MICKDIPIKNANILTLGFTFKENCLVVRNTKVIDITGELMTYNTKVTIFDPRAKPDEVLKQYNLQTFDNIEKIKNKTYNAVILAVGHEEFKDLNLKDFKCPKCVVYDVKAFLDRTGVDSRL